MLTIVAFLFSLNSDVFARENNPSVKSKISFAKTGVDQVTQSMVNIGNWGYWFTRDGVSAHDPYTSGSGGYFPRGTAGAIYIEGLVWGGIVNDPDPAKPQLRVGGNTYNNGTVSGAFNMSPTDPDARIFRIRADWRNVSDAALQREASEIFNVASGAVSASQIQELRDSYALDWQTWPVDLGAPYYDVDASGSYNPVLDTEGYPDESLGDYPGIADADQVLWFVMNDLNEGRVGQLYGSPSIGMEVQFTAWAYNQPGSGLGQIVFKKFKFFNKSGFTINDMYVAQWSDPDLGNYGDDLTGCDTTLSLMFAYNGAPADGQYAAFGLTPPAVGYDFFQGPIVAGAATDTAVFDLKKVPGYKNLPMTTYGYFGSGTEWTDPTLQNYDGTKQWYNLLRGYAPTTDVDNPTPWIVQTGPNAGAVTKYPLSGNPVDGSGDIDGVTFQPGDRRMLQCSGPFTMLDGDVQEVVVAVLGGGFKNEGNLLAIDDLKNTDDLAQTLYNTLFTTIPKPPSAPKVVASPMEDQIILNWGSDEVSVAKTEEPVISDYTFEGYNVYQLASASRSISDPTTVKIGTFDVVNGVTVINSPVFNPTAGAFYESPVQFGSDNGLKRYFIVDRDYVNGLPLYRGSSYYFAVTAYNYNGDPQLIQDRALESAATVLTVVPQDPKPGVKVTAEAGSDVEVTHSGFGEGTAMVTVVDPTVLTGHEYEIFFHLNENSETVWGVLDKTANDTLIKNRPQLESIDETDVLVIDGLDIRVSGPLPAFTKFEVTANAGGSLSPTEMGTFAFNSNGFPLLYNDLYPTGTDRPDFARQQTNGSAWGIAVNDPADPSYSRFLNRLLGYTGGFGESLSGLAFLSPRDYEVRFTATGSRGYFNWTDGTMKDVPFELWCTGTSPTDPSDDYQCLPWVLDNDADGTFSLRDGGDHAVSGGTNDPYTDAIYWVEPISKTQAGYDALLAAHEADPAGAGAEVLWAYLTNYDPWNSVAGMMRMIFVNWNGGTYVASNPASVNALLPETGTIFRITTTKPNLVTDKFTFSTEGVTYTDAAAKADVEKVNVFPNPYYGDNALETNRFNHFVTFNHLPEKATFRIFNLGGTQVRKLEKDDVSQFMQWDLLNESGLPVASGVYIVHIDMPAPINKTKVVKVFIVQPQQILEYY